MDALPIKRFSIFKRKTWHGWTTEENAAIKKAFATNLAQLKQPLHHDVTGYQTLPNTCERDVLKIKNKVRNEIDNLKVRHTQKPF